jgi:peptide/nickel transport system ATP-binding protein
MDMFRHKPTQMVKAVDCVSVELSDGETLGLVGESGSGKTTVVRSLFGLTPMTDGSATLKGKSLPKQLKQRSVDLLRNLQGVDQNPEDALNPHLTIGESLQRPLIRLRQQTSSETKNSVRQLLEQVGLDAAYITRLPHQLSGGEKQRVAIARTLAAEPNVIVCDEPTSALDVSVQARILNLLTRLQQDNKQAYLFISHDLAAISYLADRIAVMYLGKLMEVGNRESMLQPPYHPYTEALLSAVPRPDPSMKSNAIRLEGDIPSPMNTPTGCPFHTRCPRFLGDVCVNQTPQWQQGAHGHGIFCHIPLADLERDQRSLVDHQGGDD